MARELLVQESLHWQAMAVEDERSPPLLSDAGIPNHDADL